MGAGTSGSRRATLVQEVLDEIGERFAELIVVTHCGMKADDIVVSQRGAAATFVQLLGQFSVFDRYAVGLEKLDDAKLRALDRDEVTGPASEPILVAVVIDTTSCDYSVRIKINIPTRFTRHPNRCHTN